MSIQTQELSNLKETKLSVVTAELTATNLPQNGKLLVSREHHLVLLMISALETGSNKYLRFCTMSLGGAAQIPCHIMGFKRIVISV